MNLTTQTKNTGLFQVFTNDKHHLVIPDSECTFETLENLSANGFDLLWDSAPTEFEGAKYAASFGAVIPVTRKVTA